MHEQEVVVIGFQSNLVHHTCSHRYGRNTGSTDERIDFTATEVVHQFSHQDAGSSADCKGDQAQQQNAQCLQVQEMFGLQFRADRETERQRDHINDLILSRIGETIYNAALSQEITECEHADQWCSGRQKNNTENQHNQRKGNLLCLADMA